MSPKKLNINKCSYKSEQSTCDAPKWKEDDKFCIFHSEFVDIKQQKFQVEFNKFFKKAEEEPNKLKLIDGFIFPETFKFHDLIFSATIWFWNCKFFGDFELDRCEFKSDFRMNYCMISGSSNFKWCQFNKVFTFNKNVVKKNLDFHLNSVKSDAIWIYSQIDGVFSIKYSSFLGEVNILDTVVKGHWYIYAIDFSTATRTRFRNLNFMNVHFFDSKLIDIDFVGIKWRTNKKRIIIGDELVFRNQEKPIFAPYNDYKNLNNWESYLESLYLQLCTNFDKSRLFNTSAKFYISAMEMRRYSKSNWFTRNIFSWEAWYKYISLYGQSSTRTILGIIIVILICSFLISFDKNILQISNPVKENINYINILAFPSIFFNALKYNLYYIIHPAESTFYDRLTIAAFVTAWERIIILILSTFFLLALRRKFKRE